MPCKIQADLNLNMYVCVWMIEREREHSQLTMYEWKRGLETNGARKWRIWFFITQFHVKALNRFLVTCLHSLRSFLFPLSSAHTHTKIIQSMWKIYKFGFNHSWAMFWGWSRWWELVSWMVDRERIKLHTRFLFIFWCCWFFCSVLTWEPNCIYFNNVRLCAGVFQVKSST